MKDADLWSYNERWYIKPCRWFILSLLAVVLCGFFGGYVHAATLQDYISEALANNLALKQKTISYKKSRATLAEARGAFLPSLDIHARYSRAGGGRNIELPIGDLVNPIYGSLNELLGETRFPTDIPSIITPMMREEEQETKLTITQPLFQAGIYYNQRSQANLSRAKESARNQFARELVAEVKTAYFNYVKAGRVVDLLIETEKLLTENLRVSESLFRNEKATKEVVYRAQAELSDLKQQQAEADRVLNLAKVYFNFLLNRPLTTSIDLDNKPVIVHPISDLTVVEQNANDNREELRQLHFAGKGIGDLANLSKAAFLPGVFLVFDYGVEGEDYRFDGDNDFWMASVVLKWNLFNGFQDKSRVRQFKLEERRLHAQLKETRRQISMEARNAHYAVNVAVKKMKAAADRVASARQSFNIVEHKFAQGMIPQIEYLDARTALTGAEVNYITVQYDYRITLAELERVTATYPLNM